MSTRVLHLIDAPGVGWPQFDALRALVSAPAASLHHTVALLGGAIADQRAAESGLRPDLCITPALGRPELAGPRLRTLLRERDPFDVIHAWTTPSLTLARVAAPRIPVCATLSAPPPDATWSIERFTSRSAIRSASRLLCASRFVQDRWNAALQARRVNVETICLPLPVVAPPPDPQVRAALRARWGVADDVVVVLATGEPQERLDARWHTFRAGVLAVGGVAAAIVLPSRSDGLERALRYTERHHHAWPVIVDDAPMATLMQGCDMALWRAGAQQSRSEMFGAHGLALCAAGGLPCVAEEHSLSQELAAAHGSIRLVPRDDTVAMGRAVFETVDAARSVSRGAAPPMASDVVGQWRERMSRQLLRAAGSDAPYPLTDAAMA